MSAPLCIGFVLLATATVIAAWTPSEARGGDAPGPTPASPPATIADLAWVAGTWRADDKATVSEETWSPALGGAMVGTFRMVEGAKPVFYEFLLLEEDADGVVMRLRHFHPGMASWESEKDRPQTLRLVERGPNRARFQDVRPEVDFGLTYAGEGRVLTVTLKGRKKDGSPLTTEFRFTRT
jgi:hypothetical protein